MLLKEVLKKNYVTKLFEGGNIRIGQHEAENINLLVHKRDFIVPVMNQLLYGINNAYTKLYKAPLWNPKLLQSREFLSGSSLHFFDTNIPDQQFTKLKPKVGDIDTQVDINLRDNLAEFLQNAKGKKVGNATFLGYEVGNEQFSSLWQFDVPPIKVQIDFEFVEFKNGTPTPFARFAHSSAWEDIQQGVKGVFHKYAVQSLTALTKRDFLLRKMVGRGKLKKEEDVPTNDNMFSFAVSSKEGGGLRAKYEPVVNPTTMKPLVIKGLPVMKPLPPSGYEQDIDQMMQKLFGSRANPKQLKSMSQKFWSFTGILEIMNSFLKPEEKSKVLEDFINRCFGPGVQGLYKNDPERDAQEKLTAVNLMSKTLGIPLPSNFKQILDSYKSTYRMVKEASAEDVVQSKRKGIVHLEKMKDSDFLDLLDELHDKGKFKLQNIPMTVKVDGFGGRIGKSEDGRPFFETSRSGPKFGPGQFLKYHSEKGTTDPEILGRAKIFDGLQDHMMTVIQGIDQKFGKDFLKNVKIHLEILYAPFGTQTEDGRIKYVGIAYDKLPKGINLALVPLFVEKSDTGEEHPQSDKIVQAIKNIKKIGDTMFIDNSLVQNDSLDLTAMVPPLENIETFRNMLASRKRDQVAEVKVALEPIKKAVSDAIINDPNILGKDILGKDYEGIILNTNKGPVKITSTQQRDVVAKKQAAIKQVQQSQQAAKNIPNTASKTAVVAIGSFVGHRGHQQLFKYTIDRAKELGGDPYLFMGSAVGKNDPIPVPVKVKTWHMLFPNYASHISAVTQEGGTLMQKIKHELIQPQPNKPPRYDNIIIMVGEDQANMPIAQALMKSVNKFKGYEHVKATLEATPRETGISFTQLRNILKDPNATPEQQLDFWTRAFDGKEFGAQTLPAQWIEYLMNTTRQGMGITNMNKQKIKEFIQKTRPLLKEASVEQKLKILKLLKEYKQVTAPTKVATCQYCKRPETKCSCSQRESVGFAEGVAEAFNQPYSTDLEKSEHDDYDALVQLPDGSYLSIMFNKEGEGKYQVEFWRGPSQGVTGEGDSQRIFATVLNAIQRFIKEHKPQQLTFGATKNVEPGQKRESRAKLYNRLVHRYAASWGYNATINDYGNGFSYTLTRLEQGVAEGLESLDYQGNCTEDDVIDDIFGDVNNFANMVEEYGDEFTRGKLVVKYDPETDVHSFYYKTQDVTEDSLDLENSHPMDWGKKTYMIRRIAKVTGWGISDLSLASDEEIQQLYDEHVKSDIDESLILNPSDLIDVYLKGKHKKQDFTKLVASAIPNKSLEKLIDLLVTKYKVNPKTIVYGPSKKKPQNSDYLDEN